MKSEWCVHMISRCIFMWTGVQCVVQDELQHLLKHPDTAGKPILVFSNKKDRPDSMVSMPYCLYSAQCFLEGFIPVMRRT